MGQLIKARKKEISPLYMFAGRGVLFGFMLIRGFEIAGCGGIRSRAEHKKNVETYQDFIPKKFSQVCRMKQQLT